MADSTEIGFQITAFKGLNEALREFKRIANNDLYSKFEVLDTKIDALTKTMKNFNRLDFEISKSTLESMREMGNFPTTSLKNFGKFIDDLTGVSVKLDPNKMGNIRTAFNAFLSLSQLFGKEELLLAFSTLRQLSELSKDPALFKNLQDFFTSFASLRIDPVDTKVKKVVTTLQAFASFMNLEVNVTEEKLTTKINFFKGFITEVSTFLISGLQDALKDILVKSNKTVDDIDETVKRTNKISHAIHVMVGSYTKMAETLSVIEYDAKGKAIGRKVFGNKNFAKGFNDYYDEVAKFFKGTFTDDSLAVINKVDIDETKINKASRFILSFGELISAFQKLSSDKIVNTATIQKTLDGISDFFNITPPLKKGNIVELFQTFEKLVIPKSIDVTVKTISGIIRSFSRLSSEEAFNSANIEANIIALGDIFDKDKSNEPGNINKLFEILSKSKIEKNTTEFITSFKNIVSLFKTLSEMKEIQFDKIKNSFVNLSNFLNSEDSPTKTLVKQQGNGINAPIKFINDAFSQYEKLTKNQLIDNDSLRSIKNIEEFFNYFNSVIKNLTSLSKDDGEKLDPKIFEQKIKFLKTLIDSFFGSSNKKIISDLFKNKNIFSALKEIILKDSPAQRIAEFSSLDIEKLSITFKSFESLFNSLNNLNTIDIDVDKAKTSISKILEIISALTGGGIFDKIKLFMNPKINFNKKNIFSSIRMLFNDNLLSIGSDKSFVAFEKLTKLSSSLTDFQSFFKKINDQDINLSSIYNFTSAIEILMSSLTKNNSFVGGLKTFAKSLFMSSGNDVFKSILTIFSGNSLKKLSSLDVDAFFNFSDSMQRLSKSFENMKKFDINEKDIQQFSKSIEAIISIFKKLLGNSSIFKSFDIKNSILKGTLKLFGLGLDFENVKDFSKSIFYLGEGMRKLEKVGLIDKSVLEENINIIKYYVGFVNNLDIKNAKNLKTVLDLISKDVKVKKSKDGNKEGKEYGKDFVKGFKDELEIKSPSRVFTKIGKNISDGLSNGLRNLKDIFKLVSVEIAHMRLTVVSTISGLIKSIYTEIRPLKLLFKVVFFPVSLYNYAKNFTRVIKIPFQYLKQLGYNLKVTGRETNNIIKRVFGNILYGIGSINSLDKKVFSFKGFIVGLAKISLNITKFVVKHPLLMLEIFIAGYLMKKITGVVLNVAKFITKNMLKLGVNIIKSFPSIFKNIFKNTLNLFTKLKETLLNIFKGLFTGFDKIFTSIVKSLVNRFVGGFKTIGDIFTGIKKTILSIFNPIKNLASFIKTHLVLTFGDISRIVQNVGQQAFGNAIDFEAGFTKVIKTIDIADEKIPELEAMLRDLATAGTLSGLENAQQSIFDIAEAAGSLGIPVENMKEFVTTAGQMAIATNLAAGDAATFFGQFGAITTSTAYEQIGATMVALGNDFAATESQISEFALRLAGAGNSAGLSEAEILSLSAALASVGFEAEAGGTAMSTIINKLVEASAKGGSELKAFSDTAGIEAKEFAKLWNNEPTAALDKFIAGLGKLDAAQQLSVIDQLGLDGIRTSDVLRRLGNAGDILTEAIITGNEAWDENIALLEEAEKANNTTKASIERLKNNWKDLTVTIGKAFSPIIKQFADSMIYVVDILQNYFGGTSVQASLTNTMQLVADILKNVVDFGVSVANFVGQIINNNPIIQSIMSTISGIVMAIKDGLAIATQALNDFTGFGKPTSDEEEKLKTYDELIAKKKMLEEQSFFEGSTLPPLVQEYTIKAGDSMWQIAHDNGIPLEALYAANNMEGGDIILPNQKINIPMDLSAVSTAEDGTTLQSTVQTEIDAIQKQIDDLGLDNPEGIREAINSLALADYSREFDLLKINLGEGLKGALSIFSLFAMPFPTGIAVSVVSLLTTAITNDIGGLRTSLEKSGFVGNTIIQFSDSLQQVFDGVANVLSGKGLMVDSGTVNNSWDAMDELGNIIMPEQELGAFADNPIVKFVNSLYNSISSILESFGTIDTSKLQFLFDTITGFVNDKMNFLLGSIGWTIENIFAPAIKTLVDKFKELLDKVPPEKLEKAVLVIGTVIGLFALPVVLPVVVAITAISAAISGFGYALEPLTYAASDVFDFFDSILHGDWAGASTAFTSFLGNITLAVGNFFLGIADFTFSIMDSLLGIEPGTTKENTVNMINGWFDDIKYGAKLLSDFIYRTFSGMWIQVELGAIQVQKGFAKVTGQWEWVGELEARETTLANARDVGILLSDKVKEGFSEEGGLDTIIGTNKWGNEYSLRDLIKFDPEMLKNLPAESFDEFIRISNELLASGDLKNQIDAFELLDAMGIGLLPSQIQEYVGDLDGFDIATLFMTFDSETINKYVTPEQLSKFFTPLGAEITKLVTSTDFTTMSIEDKQKFFANLMDDIARVGAIDMDAASALWETLYSIVGANFSPEEASLILSQFTFKPEDIQKERDKLATAGNNILSGLFNGFTQLVSGEKPEDVLKNVGQTMIDEFNNIFQIHSPSAVMEEKGLNIVTGLVNGIINAKQSLTTEIDLLIADVNRISLAFFGIILDLTLFNISFFNAVNVFIVNKNIFKTELQDLIDKIDSVTAALGRMQVGASVSVPTVGEEGTDGGRYYGGNVERGKIYEILENNLPFEIYETNNKKFFIPNSNGNIQSPASSDINRSVGVSGNTYNTYNEAPVSIVVNGGNKSPEAIADVVYKRLENEKKQARRKLLLSGTSGV